MTNLHIALLPCLGLNTLPLLDVIKQAAEDKIKLIITTDHGTIKEVNEPVKIAGERNTNTNLRYKVGRV